MIIGCPSVVSTGGGHPRGLSVDVAVHYPGSVYYRKTVIIMDRSGHLLGPPRAILWARQGARARPCLNQGAGNGNCAEHPRIVVNIGP